MARRIFLKDLLDWFRPRDRDNGIAVGAKLSARVNEPGVMELANVADETGGQWGGFGETEGAVAEDHELLDFLAADLDPVAADPEFKERLREQLWGIVQAGGTALPKDH